MPSALKWIIYSTIFVFVVMVAAFLAVLIAPIYDQNPEHKRLFDALTPQLLLIGVGAWNFIKPFLQLILVLVIVDWILSKWGISLQSKASKIDWNVQTVIALIVIGAFAIAALGGINDGIGSLKDLALVVIGFYFGTQRKSVEMQTEKGKVTVVEEHQNEVKIQTQRAEKDKSKEDEGQQGRA